MAVEFDWTIRASDVVTWAGMVGAVITYVVNKGKEEITLKDSVQQALKELTALKMEVQKLNEVTSEFGVLKMQVALLMKWYDELRRGTGFIQARPQKGAVDDEY